MKRSGRAQRFYEDSRGASLHKAREPRDGIRARISQICPMSLLPGDRRIELTAKLLQPACRSLCLGGVKMKIQRQRPP